MTSFHVICGLGLPQSKILDTPMNWISPEKNFRRPFLFLFLENACACVLGPWPWPRASLSLASRGSVLGKAVLGLGFFGVLRLGLEPCVFDSTSAYYKSAIPVLLLAVGSINARSLFVSIHELFLYYYATIAKAC